MITGNHSTPRTDLKSPTTSSGRLLHRADPFLMRGDARFDARVEPPGKLAVVLQSLYDVKCFSHTVERSKCNDVDIFGL